jgi:hypothetical protein
MIEYNIFGSSSSTDYDLAVKVDVIPSTPEAHDMCKNFNKTLSDSLTDKKMNCNLIVVNNGQLIDCFKGTVDELNNAILDTYALHRQLHPCFVSKRLKRDVELKISRCLRGLLTMYSRTHLRPEIKLAIRGNIRQQIEVLEKIDFNILIPQGKKESLEDIYKMFAFQIGQVFGLIDNTEHYTKESMSESLPLLTPFLYREPGASPRVFNLYAKMLIDYINNKYPHILDTNETELTNVS